MRDKLPDWLKPRRQPATTRRRVFQAVAVVLLIVGWRLGVMGWSSGAKQVARELGSVGVFLGCPMASHQGQQLLYGQNTETGVALYLADGQGQNPRLIREMGEWQIVRDRLQLLGWSPDDRLFAYSRPVKGGKQSVVLCSAAVAETTATVPVDGWIAGFTWLSPSAFAYVNNTQNVHVIRQESGKWKDTVCFTNVRPTSLKSFVALSPTVVAWRGRETIWTLDCIAGKRQKLWVTETNTGIVDFSYSPERGRLLIGVTNRAGDFQLFRLHPVSGVKTPLHRMSGRTVAEVHWMDRGQGYVLVCGGPAGRSLLPSPKGEAPEGALFEHGNVEELRASDRRLYIRGSTNSEPPGIWEYSLETGQLRCLLPPTMAPLDYTKRVVHTSGLITNGGRAIGYHLWRPYGASKSGQYPLIIGQTRVGWTPYPDVAACNGYFFVNIYRPTWYTGLDNWKEDILAVYEELKKDPRIDRQRVYLYARSGETGYLCDLLREKPGLWRGAILFSPGQLPEPANCPLDSLLVDAGRGDTGQPERLGAYQARAAAAGLPVTLLLHETARHKSWSKATQRTRLEHMTTYLTQQ